MVDSEIVVLDEELAGLQQDNDFNNNTLQKKQKRKFVGTKKKSVQFTTVDVREYDITIGDNPYCSCGAPVTLDWNYTLNEQKSIDVFEANRILERRSVRKLLLNDGQRRTRLLASGHDLKEIAQASRRIEKERRKRSMNMYLQPFFLLNEAMTPSSLPAAPAPGSLDTDERNQDELEGAIQAHILEQSVESSRPDGSNNARRPSWISLRSNNTDSDNGVIPPDYSFENEDDPFLASDGSIFERYSVPVDRSQHDKATKIMLCSFQRPHMRAFHFSWISFFVAFFTWFAVTPLLGEIQESLHLSKEDIWTSSLCGSATTIIFRVIVGPVCDKVGARICMALILVASAIPTAATGLVHTPLQLNIIRACIGIAGSSFVACQYWTSSMFTREVAGTANALVAGWGNLGGGVAQILVGSFLFPLLDIIYSFTTPYTAPAEYSTAERNMTLTNSTANELSTNMTSQEKAWRTVFVVPALFSLVTAIFVVRFCDDSPKGEYRQRVLQQEISVVNPYASLIKTCCNRNTWVLVLQYACCFGVEVTMTNASALYFKDQFGQSTVSAAAIASVFGFMNLFARGLGGACSDICYRRCGGSIMGRLGWQSLSLLLEGSAIIIFANARSLLGSMCALVFVSIMVQFAEGSTFGIVPNVDRRFTGSVVGWVGAGGSLGGVIFALFFRDYHYRKAFSIMGYTAAASSLLTLSMNVKSLATSHTRR